MQSKIYNQNIDENILIACPKCGRLSNSIKCYEFPDYTVFKRCEEHEEICCSGCMRKHILSKCFKFKFFFGCIVCIRIFRLLGTLLWSMVLLCMSYTKGHSDSVKKLIHEYGLKSGVSVDLKLLLKQYNDSKNNQNYKNIEFQPKSRSGFVTFWLWLVMVSSFLLSIICFYLFVTLRDAQPKWVIRLWLWLRSLLPDDFWIEVNIPLVFLMAFYASLVMFGGYHALLIWQKKGFWFLLWVRVAVFVMLMSYCDPILLFSLTFLPLIVLFLILQITKDGKSCWSQLS